MTIAFEAPGVVLHHGDCIDVMRTLPDASVDAVITDPPYGLEFMGKDWDGADGFRRSLNEADAGRSSVFGRTSRVAPEYRTKPAGKVSGIGEADGTPFRRNGGTPAWGASGNPVCLNCGGTKYDRTRGNGCECESPEFPNHMAAQMHTFQQWCEAWAREALRVLRPGGHILAFGGSRTWHRLAAAIEDAGFEIRDSIAWLYATGFPKNPNVLKPAFEPIVVGRRPMIGTLEANQAKHGTGALNIDAVRVRRSPRDRTEYGRDRALPHANTTASLGEFAAVTPYTPHEDGRRPANVVIEQSQADVLDATAKYDDEGGPARFFPTFRFEAKAGSDERLEVGGVKHPTVKPIELMRWLVRLATPAGGTILEPFAGSGTTLEAALLEGFTVIGIERATEYLPLIEARLSKPLQVAMFGDWEASA